MTVELKVPGSPGTSSADFRCSEFEQRREIMQRKCVSSSSSFPWTQSLGQANAKWNTLCMLVISQCGKMCGNELNLVNTFSVMLGWVELALIKKWLCLLVFCKLFRSRSDPNKTSDLCFPLWCPFARPFCVSPITLFVYLYVYMTWNIYRNDAERGNLEFCLFQKLRYVWNNSNNWKTSYVR